MDLNDFLIRSNALNIWLSLNLITQPHGHRFREYTNKWQLFMLPKADSTDPVKKVGSFLLELLK